VEGEKKDAIRTPEKTRALREGDFGVFKGRSRWREKKASARQGNVGGGGKKEKKQKMLVAPALEKMERSRSALQVGEEVPRRCEAVRFTHRQTKEWRARAFERSLPRTPKSTSPRRREAEKKKKRSSRGRKRGRGTIASCSLTFGKGVGFWRRRKGRCLSKRKGRWLLGK